MNDVATTLIAHPTGRCSNRLYLGDGWAYTADEGSKHPDIFSRKKYSGVKSAHMALKPATRLTLLLIVLRVVPWT